MFRNITLEMSLKPFKKTEDKYIRSVIRKMFTQWRPLLMNRDDISVLLWTADGSEILDYAGNLDEEFEWCCYIGRANNETANENDPFELCLHTKKRPYIENPPIMTYRILKSIISIIKEEGKQMYPDSRIRVGETFDIGPEFAVSDFKYRRHREICTGNGEGGITFVNSYGLLKKDDFCYAGFPEGISDQTAFGTFLGRQSEIFLKDMGFDYLWLSNGVGFSADSWSSKGAVFDGKRFHTEKLAQTRQKVMDFWRYFRKECPDFPIETRGTNYSAGIDYASDAVALYDIYNGDLNILPPPNSPWAAIDGNFGLELMGHMTRICELPGENFLFRFYIHDPWWVNSPWYDRYNGKPHDIYLPMALSRIDQKGQTHAANVLNILSIDNSFGNMPDSCVNEPLPHLLKAEKDSADEPADFTWVYPMREYTTAESEKLLRKMMFEDWFICQAITEGFPVSSVTSCDNFLVQDKSIYKKTVLITPVPVSDSKFEREILNYSDRGGKVIYYGSAEYASNRFLDTFHLKIEDGVCGKLKMNSQYITDIYKDGIYPEEIHIRELVSNGMLNTVSEKTSKEDITAGRYTLSSAYRNSVWYRAPIGGGMKPDDGFGYITPDCGSELVKGEGLLRTLLEKFGYVIRFTKPNGKSAGNIFMLHRSNNAEILSVYAPDTTVEAHLKFPLGAPVLNGYEAEIHDGIASYRFPKSEHAECRVFVEQRKGVVGVREWAPVNYQYRRRILVSGLENATVRFFGEKYCMDKVHAVLNADPSTDEWYDADVFEFETVCSAEYGTYYEARNVTGTMVFSMPYPERMK